MNNTLKAVKPLHDQGWALHWLLPKQKRPVESKWTTGARKSWSELVKTFKPNYNVGVRLGEPSEVDGGHLACIDLDIKDPKFRKVAEKALKELVKGQKCPEVRSGSGNGSRHLYCKTDKPFKMITIHKHKEWELCVYSDGRQMAVPPSIHPSGTPYVWEFEGELPLMSFAGAQVSKENHESQIEIFKPVEVALEFYGISKKIYELIVEGEGCENKSDSLLSACLAMCGAGMSDNEILSVLTDRENFLGSVGFEHTQSDSRDRAARWIRHYTLSKAREETSGAKAFKGAIESSPLSEAEAIEQATRIKEDAPLQTAGKDDTMKLDYSLLLERFKKDHPYKTIADMKCIYAFNGTHYVDLTPIEVKGYAEKVLKPSPTEKIRMEFLNKVMANNITRKEFFTDTIEGFFNFNNGVLNLNIEDKTLLPHSEKYGFRGVLPYNYDPEADCPLFKAWLSEIMLHDKDLVSILQEFMGYIIRGGEYKYHKALWLGGDGRNGKSTFIDVLKALIGPANYSVISIKALVGDRFAASDLDGKIANFSEETSPQELSDSGPFKNITGNGDLSAQKKFGALYTFRNRAKCIMTYNTIPDLKDLSTGMLSRPLIIPFDKIIKEEDQDQNLGRKLLEELSGIFNFALEGWERLEAQGGFTMSKRSQMSLQRVRTESCNVYQWVQNNIEFIEDNPNAPKEICKPNELYREYKSNEGYPYRMIEFCRRLNSHPSMKSRHKRLENGIIYWGIKVT